MSNPLLDFSIAVTVGALALLGSMVVMPRPKPEPPPAPVEKMETPAKPPEQTQAEQVKQITADIKSVRTDLAEIKETIRLQQVLKSLPQEDSGDE